MNSFQKTILLIATVIFVLTMILFIYMMNQESNLEFPPVIGECPDYWISKKIKDIKGNLTDVCYNEHQLGKCPAYKKETGVNFNRPIYSGDNGMCVKQKESKRCGFNWDGITNGDHC